VILGSGQGVHPGEIWPMVTLIRWRIRDSRGMPPDTRAAPTIARISTVQTVLVVGMMLAATSMARGLGVLAP
jgi:putative membrane protein